MSDTCIVCLGDLRLGHNGSATPSNSNAKSPAPDDPPDISNQSAATTDASELIAHIQPCGHDLHDACLTPWVERANSCPICRATFNIVELKYYVGGSVISSYIVEDRTQVADLDPSMFLEIPEDEDEDEPCQACGECDNDHVLMYCDGCDKLWHTYCVDLQEVPRGDWYCSHCRALRGDNRPPGRRGGASRRRTRGQQRRARNQHVRHDSDWNDVWQFVFSRLGMDLDFPNDEDGAPANAMRRHRQRIQADRQQRHAWQSRVRVAELAGAGRSFREHEAAILNGSTRRARASPHPYVETPEETDAWNAFDEARAPSAEPSSSRKRKRKPGSESNSPREPLESGPIQVKRRRVSTSRDSEQPSHVEEPLTRPIPSSPVPSRVVVADGSAPSFLQSLLQEVEDSSSTVSHLPIHRPLPRAAGSPPADQSSPRPSSPNISPSPSNHSSPRAMSATPPPTHVRPISPTGLSSSIQPVFPSANYSPLRSTPEPKDSKADASSASSPRDTTLIAQPKPERLSRIPQQSRVMRRPRSTGASPMRTNMSLTAKSDVQKLVSAALKPHYNEQKISKDEYTIINRDISRMLYDKIGDFESLDLNGKARWEKVAGEEVKKAVGALRAQS